ncbi:RBBP9/YdeN family alpha/beta hydrolase [Luethyella okanaganae]|uniref:RBBP9/YdeN family alpha/beta hydrolase n=1 Tax=Luethyella okanaganae TaxID=69372 RepID=A0ABW1VHS1_9MICO
MTPRFLILHGWENRRPDGHWQHWLARELAGRGYEVAYPQLPDPDEPSLDAWLDRLRAELQRSPQSTTVVCHSLACLLWMHAVTRGGLPSVERVLLAAPPAGSVVESHAAIAEFAWPRVSPSQLAAVSRRRPHVIAGDEDPYCPDGVEVAFARPLALTFEIVPGGGHLAMDDGFGPFPRVLEWAIGEGASS